MAKLIFYYATMNSGKSLDLIRTVHNYRETGRKVLIMKPLVDTKGGGYIKTRAGLSEKCDILIPPGFSILKLMVGNLDEVSCIFIDEAQFLTSKQVNDLFIITKTLNIPVICYGLRTNFKSIEFDGSSRLLALADKLVEFKSLCRCGATARFCGRKVDGKFVTSGDDIMIDGSNDVEYVALCGDCYVKDVLNIDAEKVSSFVKKKKLQFYLNQYFYIDSIFIDCFFFFVVKFICRIEVML